MKAHRYPTQPRSARSAEVAGIWNEAVRRNLQTISFATYQSMRISELADGATDLDTMVTNHLRRSPTRSMRGSRRNAVEFRVGIFPHLDAYHAFRGYVHQTTAVVCECGVLSPTIS